MKIDELTVRDIANILANENRDVVPMAGRTTEEDLQNARIAQAHAIINADRMYGFARLDFIKTAPNFVTAPLENSQQYRRALDAARIAFRQQESGESPIGGRMYFHNRFDEYAGPRRLGSERVPMHVRYGPFQHGERTVYTVIDENPGFLVRPPNRR
jgi:hypothetical protein